MSPSAGHDPVWSDAVAQAAAIRNGAVSASELLDEYLERIDRLDGTLRAYVTVDADRARAAARRADEAVARRDASELPPFHGVAISVKDVVDVAGMPTTHSCKVLADNVATDDDAVVRRFRDAGFIVLGKTNVPEFCTSMTSSELNGICRNPWSTDLTPGGSSGGAAAALAAALCAVAHGTDGAGSVRVPASYCGLVGFKPTRGLGFDIETSNPYYGTSVDGVLTRSVRDAAAMLDVLARPGLSSTASGAAALGSIGNTWSEQPGQLRVAVSTSAPFGVVDEECAVAARRAGEVLESLGHRVETRTPEWETLLATMAGPMSVPGAAALVDVTQADRVEPRNRPMLAALAGLTVVEHARWVDAVRTAARDFLRFWDDVDVLVTPTSGMLPPSVSWAPWDQTPEEHIATFVSFPNFAQPFNLSGQPAVSLPLAWSATGLPIGVQLAGRRHGEATLVQVAAQLERAVPWVDRRPPDAIVRPEER